MDPVDVERPHDGAHRRQIFLILRRRVRLDDRARACRTRRWQWRVVLLVDHGRRGTPRTRAIRGPRLPAGTSRVRDGAILGKRGGLALPRTSRRIQLPAQAFVRAAQALMLPLQARILAPQRITLPLREFGALAKRLDVVGCRRRIVGRAIRHALCQILEKITSTEYWLMPTFTSPLLVSGVALEVDTDVLDGAPEAVGSWGQ